MDQRSLFPKKRARKWELPKTYGDEAVAMLNRYRELLGWQPVDPAKLTPHSKGTITTLAGMLREGHGPRIEQAMEHVQAREPKYRPSPATFFAGGWENVEPPRRPTRRQQIPPQQQDPAWIAAARRRHDEAVRKAREVPPAPPPANTPAPPDREAYRAALRQLRKGNRVG